MISPRAWIPAARFQVSLSSVVSSHPDKAWRQPRAPHSHKLYPAWQPGDGNKVGCCLPPELHPVTSRLLCPHPRGAGWPKLARNILTHAEMLIEERNSDYFYI